MLHIIIMFVFIYKNSDGIVAIDNYDYDLIQERFVRDATTVTVESSVTEELSNFTENPFQGITGGRDQVWAEEALREIAYYLRAHKFNEYDRRYEKKESFAPKEFYLTFPRPPLRSLHWEVHKFCEPSFLECVKYLQKRIRNSGLRRQDDTNVVIQEQGWSRSNHTEQIDTVEEECRKMQKVDNIRADPFQGPIERFQWRTTASYYMCWYTMNEVPNLARLGEKCDNFAACLDGKFGAYNHDPRANDENDYSCSRYSFCPDLCCPHRHLSKMDDCWEHEGNPCFASNSPGLRKCVLNRTQNTDFRNLILNRWNVTCRCPQIGYEWDSRYGICVDIDECLGDSHGCDLEREACLNLPGSFQCACRWGYAKRDGRCEPNQALNLIKLYSFKTDNTTHSRMATSLIKRLFKWMFRSSAPKNCVSINGLFILILSI